SASMMSAWSSALVQRLRELGWIEGRTVAIEYRWADGRAERIAELAIELVRLNPNVIVTTGTAVPAFKQATSLIPIVFTIANDPVAGGLVRSLSRPGRQCHRPVAACRRSGRQAVGHPARGCARPAPSGHPVQRRQCDDCVGTCAGGAGRAHART